MTVTGLNWMYCIRIFMCLASVLLMVGLRQAFYEICMLSVSGALQIKLLHPS